MAAARMRQIDRQIHRKMDVQAEWQTYKLAGRHQTEKYQAKRQTNRPTEDILLDR